MADTQIVRTVTIEEGALNTLEPLKESRGSFGAIKFEGIAGVEVFEGTLWRVSTTTTSTICTTTGVPIIVVVIGLGKLSHKLGEQSSKIIAIVVAIVVVDTTWRHSTDLNNTMRVVRILELHRRVIKT
ncbi:hypothetical protein L1987_23948 [Smallanthus sonchifolius]|uniref:Uncharacterized protein n=1 Tax=Smallanthus sonchifolius TaxID=185202 RepID=A0ACB9IKD7_9ASTR|nr:hypothetical protein L1987_23948 [Smallanthus sonchifolius]